MNIPHTCRSSTRSRTNIITPPSLIFSRCTHMHGNIHWEWIACNIIIYLHALFPNSLLWIMQMRQQHKHTPKGNFAWSDSWSLSSRFRKAHTNSVCVCREQNIQAMEEKRIERVGESLKTFAEVDRQILPIIGKCLDEITQAAESIESKNVSNRLIRDGSSASLCLKYLLFSYRNSTRHYWL